MICYDSCVAVEEAAVCVFFLEEEWLLFSDQSKVAKLLKK